MTAGPPTTVARMTRITKKSSAWRGPSGLVACVRPGPAHGTVQNGPPVFARAALSLIFCGVALARSGSLLQYAAARSKPMPNPWAGDAVAARAGAKLFQRECADCHGGTGQGTRRAPALARALVRQAAPGALFWVLRNGSPGRRMPSFAHLPEAQRWQIIAFLQRAIPDITRGQ